MSRLQKARSEKKYSRRKRIFAVVIIVLAVLSAMGFYFFQGRTLEIIAGEEIDLIDLNRTEAFIDLFALTYVRVYMQEGVKASDVTVNGEEMRYSAEHERWELVISGHEEGDILKIVVRSDDVRTRTQEVNVTVKEM